MAEICIQLFGPEYDKTVSAIGHRRVPVHPSITTYGGLRDSLMRKGFFGRETPGLMVLPYMVSSLAAASAVGLVVVSTDGTPAEDALGEITGYLVQEARGLTDRSEGLDESEILGPGPMKAAREQFTHLEAA